ncbi:MAG TPA: AzlD domain-containing protein [Bdellovibrionales bacterium]|nr:AzlD domain-containing protein [Bdellovibrionales bacterium]
MSHASIVIAMLLLGGITFAYRYSFISSHGRKFAARIPEGLLKLLAPATFTAIIANSILSAQSDPQVLKQKLVVAGCSVIVAFVTKSIIATLAFGLILLYLIQHF